jgi:hypothetical protein
MCINHVDLLIKRLSVKLPLSPRIVPAHRVTRHTHDPERL